MDRISHTFLWPNLAVPVGHRFVMGFVLVAPRNFTINLNQNPRSRPYTEGVSCEQMSNAEEDMNANTKNTGTKPTIIE